MMEKITYENANRFSYQSNYDNLSVVLTGFEPNADGVVLRYTREKGKTSCEAWFCRVINSVSWSDYPDLYDREVLDEETGYPDSLCEGRYDVSAEFITDDDCMYAYLEYIRRLTDDETETMWDSLMLPQSLKFENSKV